MRVGVAHELSRLAGRTGRGTIGHGEASDRRGYGDPNVDMGRFRRDVITRVKAGASGASRKEWTDMDTKKEVEDIVRKVVREELKPTNGALAWLKERVGGTGKVPSLTDGLRSLRDRLDAK